MKNVGVTFHPLAQTALGSFCVAAFLLVSPAQARYENPRFSGQGQGGVWIKSPDGSQQAFKGAASRQGSRYLTESPYAHRGQPQQPPLEVLPLLPNSPGYPHGGYAMATPQDLPPTRFGGKGVPLTKPLATTPKANTKPIPAAISAPVIAAVTPPVEKTPRPVVAEPVSTAQPVISAPQPIQQAKQEKPVAVQAAKKQEAQLAQAEPVMAAPLKLTIAPQPAQQQAALEMPQTVSLRKPVNTGRKEAKLVAPNMTQMGETKTTVVATNLQVTPTEEMGLSKIQLAVPEVLKAAEPQPEKSKKETPQLAMASAAAAAQLAMLAPAAGNEPERVEVPPKPVDLTEPPLMSQDVAALPEPVETPESKKVFTPLHAQSEDPLDRESLAIIKAAMNEMTEGGPATPALPFTPAAPEQPKMMAMSETRREEAPAQPDLPPRSTVTTLVISPNGKQEDAPIAPVMTTDVASLSPESKAIINTLPSDIGTPKAEAPKKPIALERSSAKDLALDDVKTHEAIGIKIEVKQPKRSVQDYLELAYQALIEENIHRAQEYYQQAVDADPDNVDALFGLASTSHRLNERDKARGLYSQILARDPRNLETLNNFLVLISEESPQDALAELQILEKKNPDFDPIPAQIAAIYARKGDFPAAIEQISRAIALSPDNMMYRYNLAIMLDHGGYTEKAAEAYQMLVRAHQDGKAIPADLSSIQERLIFLMNNQAS
jgi:Tfp pilus assembly protein PilF